jgi:4-diphosphocytidyl-2-C-methyl-D-erythritol kinase
MSDDLTEFAPAKVNLTLQVGRARGDGLHPLQSITVFADWGDEIAVEPSTGLHLNVQGDHLDEIGDPNSNLVLKAAYALRAAADKPEFGAEISLSKRLPVAAGLGGGSSDAAATLRALNRLWDLDFSTKQLAEIGTVVGADVPACVFARPLMMEGIGEKISPLMAWPDLNAVIINPRQRVSTGEVFKKFDSNSPEPLGLEKIPALGSFDTVISRLLDSQNKLESPAIEIAPVISECLAALRDTDDIKLARMSGSGASCFGLYPNSMSARAAVDRLESEHPDWLAEATILRGVA